MFGILGDLRHALRIYWRTPVASGLAIIALAIAMAFVGAFLSMYVDLVLRPHPGFEQSGRIMTFGQNDGSRLSGLPFALIERIDRELPSVETIVGAQTRTQTTAGDPPVQEAFELVTRGFSSGLRPHLELGRGFEDAEHDPEAERVVIVSYRYWQDRLGGDPAVLDTPIEITLRPNTLRIVDGRPEQPEPVTADFRVVGIMSDEMRGLNNDRVTHWLPFERSAETLYGELQRIRSLSLQPFGRVAGGVSPGALAEQLNARYLGPSDEYRLQPGLRLDAINGIVRNMNQQRDLERQLRLFLVGSLLLALVAAANVSLFLLARAPGRRRELGIRLAVGAPLGRLARQLASEAGLLVLLAAAIGLAGSVWLAGFLRGLAFLRAAAFRDVTLFDWRVLTLVASFLALVTLLVSLAPVLGIRRLGIAASSRQVAARASIAQRVAGASQIAIAGTMGGAAIAFGWYLGVMIFGYPGYETRDLHVVSVTPAALTRAISAAAGGAITIENVVVEFARLKEVLSAQPGIDAVSIGSPIPGASTSASRYGFPHPSDPTRQLQIQVGTVDDSFMQMLGLRLHSGRVPDENETGVVIVNRTLGRLVWDRDDVVGESLPISFGVGRRTEVVGVMEDIPFGHPAEDPQPIALVSGNTDAFFNTNMLVQSPLPAAELLQQLQRLSADGAIEMTVNGARSLREARMQVIAADRARGFLTIATATLVVLLAALGFYGTQRYLVTAGRREYAIRASIGAGPKALGRLVILRGLTLGLPGLAVGALLAFITVAWLRDGFVSRDVSAFAVTVVVVAGLVLLLVAASLGPARQAMRTQPAPLLREE